MAKEDEKQPVREMTPFELERQRRVREIFGWKMILLYPISFLLRLWLATLRVQIDQEALCFLNNNKQSLIVAFWHNRLLIAAKLSQRFRRWGKMNGLVSPSSDGAWLAAFFKTLGVGTVRGSTSRRGGVAMMEIHRKLANGEDIAITPDGPRGPCYKFNPGAILLAQKTHCPIVLVGSEYGCAVRLKSWDRFIIPLPFSKVSVRIRVYPYEKSWDELSPRVLAGYFEGELKAITDA